MINKYFRSHLFLAFCLHCVILQTNAACNKSNGGYSYLVIVTLFLKSFEKRKIYCLLHTFNSIAVQHAFHNNWRRDRWLYMYIQTL